MEILARNRMAKHNIEKLVEEIRYQRITYLLMVFLIFGSILDLSSKNDTLNLIDSVTVVFAMTTCYLWLRKTVILAGLLIYVFPYNIELLFHPLFQETSSSSTHLMSWVSRLESLGLLLGLIGVIDSLIGDRYLNHKVYVESKFLFALIFGGTIVFQVLMYFRQ